jgi:hypothetical protein
MFRRKTAAITSLLAASLLVPACSSLPGRVELPGRLPFIVRLKPVELSAATTNAAGEPDAAGPKLPPIFPAADELTRALTDALADSGLFTHVLSKPLPQVPADLEMEIAVLGDDFGGGRAKVDRAVLSTIVWLFAGHLSWIIPDREFPSSKVRLSMTLRRVRGADAKGPGVEREVVYQEDLLLSGIELSLSERADVSEWLKNIVLPPWWDDGDPAITGRSLAGKTAEFFAANAPQRIYSNLPALYHQKLDCFLVEGPGAGELTLLSRQAVRRVSIGCIEGGRRELSPEDLSDAEVQGDDERGALRLYFSQRQVGVGSSPLDRFYRILLRPEETGFIQVDAVLSEGQGSAGEWTVFWEPESIPAPSSLARS